MSRCGGSEFTEHDCGPDTYDDDINYTSESCDSCGLWHDGLTDRWLIDVTRWQEEEDAEEFRAGGAITCWQCGLSWVVRGEPPADRRTLGVHAVPTNGMTDFGAMFHLCPDCGSLVTCAQCTADEVASKEVRDDDETNLAAAKPTPIVLRTQVGRRWDRNICPHAAL